MTTHRCDIICIELHCLQIMVKAKKYVVVNPFVGEPKKSDFQIVEEELPALQENG